MRKVITLKDGTKIVQNTNWVSGYEGSGVLLPSGQVLTTRDRLFGVTDAELERLVSTRVGFVPAV